MSSRSTTTGRVPPAIVILALLAGITALACRLWFCLSLGLSMEALPPVTRFVADLIGYSGGK